MQWNDSIKGIHVIQHFQCGDMEELGSQIDSIIEPLSNPVVIIINLVNNASAKHSHTVSNSSGKRKSKRYMIYHALKKYPYTEKILLEGGRDMVLFSSKEFPND